jgi:hypothetical protein
VNWGRRGDASVQGRRALATHSPGEKEGGTSSNLWWIKSFGLLNDGPGKEMAFQERRRGSTRAKQCAATLGSGSSMRGKRHGSEARPELILVLRMQIRESEAMRKQGNGRNRPCEIYQPPILSLLRLSISFFTQQQ